MLSVYAAKSKNSLNFEEGTDELKNKPGVNGSVPAQIFLRVLFVVAVYISSWLLSHASTAMFVSTVTLVPAMVFSAVQRPWEGRQVTRRCIIKILESAGLTLAMLILWSFGLRHLGPVRTLMIEGAELPIFYLATFSMKRLKASRRKLRGIALLLVAYLLIGLDASWSVPSREINTRVATNVRTHLKATGQKIQQFHHKIRSRQGRKLLDLNEIEVVDSSQGAPPGAPTTEEVAIYETKLTPWLAVAAVSCACLTRQAAKGSAEHSAGMVGGMRRLTSMSSLAAAAIALPGGIFSVFSPAMRPSLPWLLFILGAAFVAGMLLVLPYYTQSSAMSDTSEHFSAASLVTLAVIISNAILGYDADGGVSCLLALAFPLGVVGLWLLMQGDHSKLELPDIETAAWSLFCRVQKTMRKIFAAARQLRAYIKDTREHHESWQLFSFLVFQAFMVLVEAMYGSFTNSLGLLTVSSDTLLCCLALSISLLGTRFTQSRQSSNEVSYGYERLEPLCGFVNAVLLVFVGILVLLESVERHIEGALVEENRVLVVTAIGFAFNCLGLVFFPLDRGGLNVHSAVLHIAGNTAASGGLFLSTAMRRFLNVYWADGIISSCISGLILCVAFPTMVKSADCLLLSVPTHKVKAFECCEKQMKEHTNVVLLQSFHLWSLTSSKLVVSIRAVVKDECDPTEMTTLLRSLVHEHIGQAEIVVQVMKERMMHGRLTDADPQRSQRVDKKVHLLL
mmetsp:Transcript_5004/g.15012  ORF Transcript_5004/g.15012 Transcript_5004/m.15012 type:complete len:735 (+) Transcript_5004:254-2458(+)